MHLKLRLSPCPNDTYIFDALLNGHIDTGAYTFEPVFADVEELNIAARNKGIAITKMSYRAFFDVKDDYYLLRSGGALGRGCGPLIIANKNIDLSNLSAYSIAIPGKYTTANFLLQFAFPKIVNRHEVIFSNIENDVLEGKYDLGLIIHESRFTFSDKGLIQVADLGEIWEQKTGAPIPLGCIAVNKHISKDHALNIEKLVKDSIIYAKRHPTASRPFISKHAQELSETVQQSHIDLYVNDYSIDLGEDGLAAISVMGRHILGEPGFNARRLCISGD